MNSSTFPHEGILIVDINKRIVFADARTCDLLNTTSTELVGKHCSEVRHVFPCAEESCQSGYDCRLIMGQESEKRTNRLATFSSSTVRSLEGSALGVLHVVTLPEKIEDRTRGNKGSFEGIVGQSPSILKLFEMIELVAKTGVSVHVSGESGTGKELVVEAIHNLSNRKHKRLVKVNCSTIAPTLLESSLFGHVRGAFTGAHKDQRGFIEHADGGTLFLDEIGDVSLDIQVKLLRLLQSREYQRVGESQTRHCDLRIVTATNQNLLNLVEVGKLREDFYYRINVFPVYVPPLRERLDDLPALIEHFVALFNGRFSKDILGISERALEMLKSRSWPGNIRELEHAIEHAFVKASNGFLQVEHFPFGPSTLTPSDPEVTQSEESIILRELENSGGKVNEAAKRLGYSRVTLWKKMRRYGISRGSSALISS